MALPRLLPFRLVPFLAAVIGRLGSPLPLLPPLPTGASDRLLLLALAARCRGGFGDAAAATGDTGEATAPAATTATDRCLGVTACLAGIATAVGLGVLRGLTASLPHGLVRPLSPLLRRTHSLTFRSCDAVATACEVAATAVTFSVCPASVPLQTARSTDHRRTRPSPPPETACPSGVRAQQVTRLEWPVSVLRQCFLRRSHALSVPSWLPLNRRPPSALTATHETTSACAVVPPWPSTKLEMQRPDLASHTRTVLSYDAEATSQVAVGLVVTCVIQSVWPQKAPRGTVA